MPTKPLDLLIISNLGHDAEFIKHQINHYFLQSGAITKQEVAVKYKSLTEKVLRQRTKDF